MSEWLIKRGWKASKEALKRLQGDKKTLLSEHCGSYKSWIENQVRLKAQL